LKEQCEKIDNAPRNINLADDNAIQIAALLKKFLRDLPEPLLTNHLYDLFMCVTSNLPLNF
jgi:RhoGAP domain